jgi:protein AATF/BFR2
MLALHSALAQQHPAAAAAASQALQQRQQEQHEQQAGSAGGSKRRRSLGGIGLLATGGQQVNEQAPEAAASTGYGGLCSDASSAWAAVSGAISSLAGFRDASLDKWHRRTVLSSSTAALRGSSGLRALQQSISSQVSTKVVQLHTS